MRVTVDATICAGCHICELTCSFHHLQHFAPRRSSIEIFKDPQTREIIPKVHPKPKFNRIGCDGCAELQYPLCAASCPADAIMVADRMSA